MPRSSDEGRQAPRRAPQAVLGAVALLLLAVLVPSASATSTAAGRLAVTPFAAPTVTTTTGISPSYFCGPPHDGPTTDDVARDRHALPRFKVVYAYASGMPNHFATYADFIARTMATTSGIVADNSGTRGVRLDLGTACGPNVVDITVVALPRTLQQYADIQNPKQRFFAIAADVRSKIGPAPGGQRWNTVIWADQLRLGPEAGLADDTTSALFGNGEPDPVRNGTSTGGKTAMILGQETFGAPEADDFLKDPSDTAADRLANHAVVALHEMVHTMGGVPAGAPHTTGDGHCTDEWDLMCYGAEVTFPCPDAAAANSFRLDCGRDDYFRPEGGLVDRSGRATWNVHDSPFLCAIATCATGDGAPPVAALPSVTGPAGSRVTLDASASSDDTGPLRYRWDLDGTPGYEVATEGDPRVIATVPAAGAAPVGVRVYDADGRTATADASVAVAPLAGPGPGPGTGVPVPPGGGTPSAPAAAPTVAALKLAGGRRRGTRLTITLRLSRPARTTVELLRRTPGRRVGAACRTTARKGRRCTALVRVRRVTVKVTGTTARKVALGRVARAGRYTIRVTPSGGKARTASLRTR